MNFKSKNGITLIALVITIIVLLILAGVSISALVGDNGIVIKAKDAAQKFDNSKVLELDTLDDLEKYIGQTTKLPTTMWTGTMSGELAERPAGQRPVFGDTPEDSMESTITGKIVLPKLLNDCSQQYILTIDSDLYKGDIALKVYGLRNAYTAFSGVDSENNYIVEFRYIHNDVSTFFEGEDVALIEYYSDGNEAMIYYDYERLGEDFKITKIQSIYKEYTGFANILAKSEERLTYQDALDCAKFCIDSKNLGYEYLNGLSTEYEVLNETLEMESLNEIYNSKVDTLKTLEGPLVDQMYLLVLTSMYMNVDLVGFTEEELSVLKGISTEQGFVGGVLSSVLDLFDTVFNRYTYVDWVAENEYLNEFYTRIIGNSIIPTIIQINDAIIKDVNEDGSVSTVTTFSAASYIQEPIHQDTGLAGMEYRIDADLWALLGPAYAEYGSVENAPKELLAKLQEVFYNYKPEKEQSGVNIYTIFAVYANSRGEINAPYLDYLAKALYDKGFKANSSGLSIGWNAFVVPDSITAFLGLAEEYNFLDDTENIQKQGLDSVKYEVNEGIIELLALKAEAQASKDKETEE